MGTALPRLENRRHDEPDTLNYAVSSLDDAMLDRFVSIEITPNLEDYIDYSLHPALRRRSCLPYRSRYASSIKKPRKARPCKIADAPRLDRVQELLNTCSLPITD
jgi:hypothetical protein